MDREWLGRLHARQEDGQDIGTRFAWIRHAIQRTQQRLQLRRQDAALQQRRGLEDIEILLRRQAVKGVFECQRNDGLVDEWHTQPRDLHLGAAVLDGTAAQHTHRRPLAGRPHTNHRIA